MCGRKQPSLSGLPHDSWFLGEEEFLALSLFMLMATKNLPLTLKSCGWGTRPIFIQHPKRKLYLCMNLSIHSVFNISCFFDEVAKVIAALFTRWSNRRCDLLDGLLELNNNLKTIVSFMGKLSCMLHDFEGTTNLTFYVKSPSRVPCSDCSGQPRSSSGSLSHSLSWCSKVHGLNLKIASGTEIWQSHLSEAVRQISTRLPSPSLLLVFAFLSGQQPTCSTCLNERPSVVRLRLCMARNTNNMADSHNRSDWTI